MARVNTVKTIIFNTSRIEFIVEITLRDSFYFQYKQSTGMRIHNII